MISQGFWGNLGSISTTPQSCVRAYPGQVTGPAKFLDGHVYALVKWQGRAATLEARSGFQV